MRLTPRRRRDDEQLEESKTGIGGGGGYIPRLATRQLTDTHEGRPLYITLEGGKLAKKVTWVREKGGGSREDFGGV